MKEVKMRKMLSSLLVLFAVAFLFQAKPAQAAEDSAADSLAAIFGPAVFDAADEGALCSARLARRPALTPGESGQARKPRRSSVPPGASMART
jgi:hypothetical protein